MVKGNLTKDKHVGIYKDTADQDKVWIHVRTPQGVLRFAISKADFINGWFSEKDPTGLGPRDCPYLRQQGAVNELQRRLGHPLHPALCDAIMRYAFTPTLMNRVGKRRGLRLQWVKPRGGGRGDEGKGRKGPADRIRQLPE